MGQPFNIGVGSTVTVPSWGPEEFRVKADHGHEVTLSNGERVYKAKCVARISVAGVRQNRAARAEAAARIGTGRRR